MSKYVGSFVCPENICLGEPVSGRIEKTLKKVIDGVNYVEIFVRDSGGREAVLYLEKSKLDEPYEFLDFSNEEIKIYADTFLCAIEF